MLHKAVQLLTKAARSNLEAMPDDSHSNLGWDADEKRFTTHPLPAETGPIVAALAMAPLRIELNAGEKTIVSGPIVGETYTSVSEWFDDRLSKCGLRPASETEITYELPPSVAAVERFKPDRLQAELAAFCAWFDLASSILEKFVERHGILKPGPVRCWPHHFDIATYVQLEQGDFETAKGIGVGMSPGDESYDQPYYYVNPWPHMDPQKLPDPPLPGHWHTAGFVGAIATGDEVLSLSQPEAGMNEFVNAAFNIGRAQINA